MNCHHRSEIEAGEAALERMSASMSEAQAKQREAEAKLKATQDALAEKDSMISYINEEVDRVKGELRLYWSCRSLAAKSTGSLIGSRGEFVCLLNHVQPPQASLSNVRAGCVRRGMLHDTRQSGRSQSEMQQSLRSRTCGSRLGALAKS